MVTPFAQAWGTTQRFGAATTNYSEIDGNGSLTFTGSARIAPRIKSATKSASPFTAFDDGLTTYYRINSASGAIVANLPDSNANKGLILTFKKINSGGSSITITPAGSDNIQGAGTYSLSTQWQYVSLKAADPHWEIVADG